MQNNSSGVFGQWGYWAWLTIAVILAMAAWIVFKNISIDWPVRLYIVQSGSMAPSIMAGDLILVEKSISYVQNEVITFIDSEGRTVTHRIIEINSKDSPPHYATKGDANPNADKLIVAHDQVIGKVSLVLPKLGFVASFGKSRNGILLLIVIPTALIIYDEFRRTRRH